MTRNRSVIPLVLCLAAPSALAAQGGGTIVGVVAGYTTTELLFSPDAETAEADGILIGAFVDAETPLGWLSIRAEGAYTQRGGEVLADVQGVPANSRIRADYLSFSVQARGGISIGPARLHVVAGPVVDQLIRSRMDLPLAQVLDRESSTVFGVSAGIGVGVWVSERVFAEVEGRIVEGLGDAFSGDFISVRNRSTEIVARVGVPIRR